MNLYRGRINRKYYIIGTLSLWVPTLPFSLSIGFLPDEIVFESTIYGLLLMLVWAVFVALFFPLTIRRFHDLGHSGWRALTLFVPLVNVIVVFYLFLAKPQASANKYDATPSNNLKFSEIFFGTPSQGEDREREHLQSTTQFPYDKTTEH